MDKFDSYLENIRKGIKEKYVVLDCPVAFYKGKMVIFAHTDTSGSAHVFGGSLPTILNTPSGSRLHALLNIDVSSCELLNGVRFSKIPLIYPFTHDGGSVSYTISPEGNAVKIENLEPAKASDTWPYSGYPEILPLRSLTSSHAIDITRDEFEIILWQGLWQQDLENELVVVMPSPSEEYGVSLWGEDGDNAGVMCVFYINTLTGGIRAENQCD
jgi:hypothetical protein